MVLQYQYQWKQLCIPLAMKNGDTLMQNIHQLTAYTLQVTRDNLFHLLQTCKNNLFIIVFLSCCKLNISSYVIVGIFEISSHPNPLSISNYISYLVDLDGPAIILVPESIANGQGLSLEQISESSLPILIYSQSNVQYRGLFTSWYWISPSIRELFTSPKEIKESSLSSSLDM